VHVFGLTGGFASGKSAVAARFQARGVPVLDADQLARDVVTPGSEGLRAVAQAFGEDLVDSSGSLDRKELGSRIFADPEARRRLEAILHPRIQGLMKERKGELEAKGELVACYEAPLLVEVGIADELRPLVVVTAPAREQLRRGKARDGLGDAAVRARLLSQLPLERKVAVADVVIDNSGSFEELTRQADAALDDVLDRIGVPRTRYPRPGG
jgi:dephospho-CoA kinase